MSKYDDWLKDFLSGKTEVPAEGPSENSSVHSVRRFIEGKNRIWEIAFTYTGRLVVRAGKLRADGTTVDWKEWTTQHEVKIP